MPSRSTHNRDNCGGRPTGVARNRTLAPRGAGSDQKGDTIVAANGRAQEQPDGPRPSARTAARRRRRGSREKHYENAKGIKRTR